MSAPINKYLCFAHNNRAERQHDALLYGICSYCIRIFTCMPIPFMHTLISIY